MKGPIPSHFEICDLVEGFAQNKLVLHPGFVTASLHNAANHNRIFEKKQDIFWKLILHKQTAQRSHGTVRLLLSTIATLHLCPK